MNGELFDVLLLLLKKKYPCNHVFIELLINYSKKPILSGSALNHHYINNQHNLIVSLKY